MQDKNKQIISVITNDAVNEKFRKLMDKQRYQIVSQRLDNALVDVMLPNFFCIVIDIESLENADRDKFDLLEDIRQRNGNIGIIVLVDDITKSEVRKFLAIENVLVVSPSVADCVAMYDILNFFGMLHNIDVNMSVSQYITSEQKTYKVPNDIMIVKPITEHLIRDLVSMGIVGYDKLYNIKFGVQEMLINAIEHGNLNISYEEKTNLLNSGGDISRFINERAAQAEYQNKFVTVEYYLSQDGVKYVIRDQGDGFDWKNTPLEITAETFDIVHGRGILMSNKAFDEFKYNEKGNEITMIIRKKS